MASIRQLKKDADYLTFAVIGDCMVYQEWAEGANDQEIQDIIQSIITYRNELRSKINNHPEFEEPKGRQKYYKGLASEMLNTVDEKFRQLSEIVRKTEKAVQ